VVGSAVTELDPLAPALARGVEHRRTLLNLAGSAMSAEEAGQILGITRQAVDKRRRAGTLLAVREGSDWRYPACQFEDGEVVAGPPESCAASIRQTPGWCLTSSSPQTRSWQAGRRLRR
jgi:hypothetical protein